jgi:hypothetical protein
VSTLVTATSPRLTLASSDPVFELPANLFTKWFGPGKAIPLYTIIFGVLSIAMAFVKNFGASLAVRFLLGYVSSLAVAANHGAE